MFYLVDETTGVTTQQKVNANWDAAVAGDDSHRGSLGALDAGGSGSPVSVGASPSAVASMRKNIFKKKAGLKAVESARGIQVTHLRQ